MIEGIKLLLSHGVSGYLIVVAGLFCIAISLERLYFLMFAYSFDSSAALGNAKEAVLKRNYSKALQVCGREERNPELVVLKEGLVAAESGREAMRSALTSAVLSVSKQCEKHLSFLALIASSATLLGLFGTIMGLIKTFQGIAGADPTEKARLLGLGISEAMYSTAAGVIVGVAAMVVHTICVSKADAITGKAQKVALDFMNWIEISERGPR